MWLSDYNVHFSSVLQFNIVTCLSFTRTIARWAYKTYLYYVPSNFATIFPQLFHLRPAHHYHSLFVSFQSLVALCISLYIYVPYYVHYCTCQPVTPKRMRFLPFPLILCIFWLNKLLFCVQFRFNFSLVYIWRFQ